jgi:probable F420-dependent oxidoreductase
MGNIAQLGEALGFDYLTLTDHVALPDTSTPGYPYSTTGEFYTPDPGHRVEQLTTAAWVAAKTSKIRLVLAVMVVPHRPAVVTSKMLSTIDVLSGGRLVVGIGAGWLKVELDAVSTTPFAERGAVTDEYMDAMRTIWTQDKPVFHGKYVHIDGLLTDPKPLQKPHPPIWVGGESGPSMRRAARIGDAWYPIGSNNAHLLDTLPRPHPRHDQGRRPRPRRDGRRLPRQAPRPARAPRHRRQPETLHRHRRQHHRGYRRRPGNRRHRDRLRLRRPRRRQISGRHEKIPQ